MSLLSLYSVPNHCDASLLGITLNSFCQVFFFLVYIALCPLYMEAIYSPMYRITVSNS